MDHIFGDGEAVLGLGFVVNDGAVGSTRADSVETGASVQRLGCSEVVYFLGGLVFSDGGKLGSPGPEFGHGDTINDVASSEA